MLAVLHEQREQLDEEEHHIATSLDWLIPARRTKYEKRLAAIKGQRNTIDEVERQVQREGKRPVFLWQLYFGNVFSANDGFDLMLANPPYIRADPVFRHLTNDIERQEAIVRWQSYRTMLVASKVYETLSKNGICTLRFWSGPSKS